MTKEEFMEKVKEHKKGIISGVVGVLFLASVGTGAVIAFNNAEDEAVLAQTKPRVESELKKVDRIDTKKDIKATTIKKDDKKVEDAKKDDKKVDDKKSEVKKTETKKTDTKKDTTVAKADNKKQQSGGGTTSNPAPSQPNPPKKEESTHVHAWEQQYKQEDQGHSESQLVSEAWDEPIYGTQTVYFCTGCGADITEAFKANGGSMKWHRDSCPAGAPGWRDDVQEVITGYTHHDAVYKDVWIPNIVDVPTYKKCACGATQ